MSKISRILRRQIDRGQWVRVGHQNQEPYELLFGPKIIFDPKYFWVLNFFWSKIFLDTKFFAYKIILDTKSFWTHDFSEPTIFF